MDTVGSVMTSVIDKVFDESKETKPAEPIAVKAEEKIV
jgi:superfamily I DNA and/or RNA helicase